MMKASKLLFFIFPLFVVLSCSRVELEEVDGGGKQPTETTDDDGDYDVEDDENPDKFFSVADFMSHDFGDKSVWVVGYIVGDCTKNIKNAEWEKPFTYDTAILLADESGETDSEKVIAIQLRAGELRELFSLHLNPDNYGRKVCFYGTKQKYLGVPGMKNDIGGYGWADE
ncbi:DUF6359 domain-containing protein [Prevotella corporis]|uniref:DUF6359 domain-containing protein n=1 Tax=Prevotella corporis TaxID=28128 RepID=UPI0003F4B1C2|nr:DUF6359 domain-containing protein [Prevotella corporis]